MRPRYIVSLCFFTCSLIFFTYEVKAQEALAASLAQVTGGTVILRGSGNPRGPFRLEGQNFVLNGSLDSGSIHACNPCLQGQRVRLDSIFSGSSIRSGPAEVDGITYSRLYYEGQMNFEVGAITIPFFAPINQIFIVTQFTLSGVMRACTTPTVNGCPQGWVFEHTLSGQGKVKLRLANPNKAMGANYRREYSWDYLAYTFLNTQMTAPKEQPDAKKN